MRRTTFVATCLAALLIVGCAGSQVQYGDAGAVETVTIDFGSTDLQIIADQMVDSLLASPVLANGERPVLYVHNVRNKTDEHVDTKNITDKIRTAILRSGLVRVTAAMEVGNELVSQLEHQVDSGLVRPDTAKQFGNQVGADYFLFGELTNIRKSTKRVEDVYMKFTLNLVDIESGLIEWADEREIRKTDKRRTFGR
jgi:penicillin-binding protein activator